MTVSVANEQLNNVDEMLSSVKKAVEKADSVMDRNTKSFDKVLDKSIEKFNKNNDTVKNSEKVVVKNKTVKGDTDLKASLKNSLNKSQEKVDEADNWSEFKEVLSEITEEVNAETSLDLTLTKDINEIISQLKESIEKATEIVEEVNDEEESEVVEELISLIEIQQDTNLDNTSKEINQNSAEQSSQVPFEQIVTFYDKSISLELSNEQLQMEKQEDSILLENNSLDQTEIIEFAESLTEEITTEKTSEKNISDDLSSLLDEDMLKDLKIESLEAQADTTGGETLMQRQAPEEVAIKAMINSEIEAFDVKLETTQNAQLTQQVQSKPVEINPSRILEQISKQLEGLQNGSKVNIVLNPESLGKVNIQLLSTKEGLMAQLTVTTQEARDILMKGLEGLKDTLLAQGVNVDNVSVKVADAQKSEYEQDWTEQEGSRGGNKGQKNTNKEEKEKGLFEQMMQQTLNDENGNV